MTPSGGIRNITIPRSIIDDLTSGGGGHAEEQSGTCEHQCHKPLTSTPITRCRDIYLKIEKLPAYSPVAPDDAEHEAYRRDCMRNEDHQDRHISATEVERWRLDALVYREYLESDYTVLKTDPLVSADITEPRAERRIRGTVIYASPGERLFIQGTFNYNCRFHPMSGVVRVTAMGPMTAAVQILDRPGPVRSGGCHHPARRHRDLDARRQRAAHVQRHWRGGPRVGGGAMASDFFTAGRFVTSVPS